MANTFILIETITVGSGGAANAEFTSIPATFTDLKLVMSARSTRAAIDDQVMININGTGIGTTFKSLPLFGEGSGTPSSTSYTTGRVLVGIFGTSSTASTFSSTEFYIPNYAGSNNKSISVDNVTENNATIAFTELSAALYSNTAVISSIALSTGIGLFAQHSSFSLYGIKST